MSKAYMIYAAIGLCLVILCIGLIRLSRYTPVDGALRKLGASEAQYNEARETVLMSTGEPAPVLLRFAVDTRKPRRARIHALRLLAELAQHQPSSSGNADLAPLLSDTSHALRLQVLQTMERFSSMDGADSVARIFSSTADSALFTQSLRTLLSCANPLERRVRDAVKSADTSAIDSCVRIANRLPAGRAGVVLNAAGFYAGRGDSLRARMLRSSLGIIRDFWVAGPFGMNRTTEYYKVFGPETRPFNPADRFDAPDGRKTGWSRLHDDAPDGTIFLSRHFPQPNRCVEYFMTYVIAPEQRSAILFFGSWEGIRVWFNGRLLLTDKKLDFLRMDFDAARVSLNPGPNELIFRIDRYMGDWGMSCRVTGIDGNVMNDVICTLEMK